MASVADTRIGILAGAGRFPLGLLRQACRLERKTHVVALHHVTLPAVAQKATSRQWLHVGRLAPLCRSFKEAEVGQIILAGGVPWNPFQVLPRFDGKALKILPALLQGDDSLLRRVAAIVEESGIAVVGPDELLGAMSRDPGVLAGQPPSTEMGRLAIRGLDAALELGRRDRGQAVVVTRDLLWSESRSGTAGLLERARRAKLGGGVLVKVAKPSQDLRFDRPTIGPTTVSDAARAGLAAIIIEAKKTIIVDPEETIALAIELGIAIWSLSGSTVSSPEATLGLR